MTIGRFLATLYAVLFLVLSLYAGVSFMQTYGELTNLKTVEQQNRERLVHAEKELRSQQQTLTLLKEDPQYVESVIRRQMGYVKPKEVIFRFRGESTPAQNANPPLN